MKLSEQLVPEGSIAQEFQRFHRANPQVYSTLVDLAREAQEKGRRRIGIGMLWEVMRWHMFLQTDSEDAWSLNNTFRSRYARMIMRRERDLEGIFEVRGLRSV